MINSEPRLIHFPLSLRDAVYRLLDVAAIVAGALLAAGWSRLPPSEHNLTAIWAGIAVYYLVAEASGAYCHGRGASADREVLSAMIAWVVALPIVITLGFLLGHTDHFPRLFLAAWGVAGAGLLGLGRILLRLGQQWIRARGYNVRRYAIVGVNELGFALARNIEQAPELGLKLVGFYDDRPTRRLPAIPADVGVRAGDLDLLVAHSRRREIDTIYITFPMRAEGRIRRILERLSDTTASVYIVPDFFVFELLHSRWTSISGLPAVSVFENPLLGINGLVKRGVDLTLATAFLAVAAGPMALIGLAVKLGSPGPVFFRQKRYGLDGREILVWKFRTMQACEEDAVVKQAVPGDCRVTAVGRFLRRTSLDELPQLFNVLSGSMSLVGPRPHANVHNEEYRTLIRGYMLRHKVKPGITGLAQVSGFRGETDTLGKMESRIQCDHRYIRQWSLWLDIKILCKTLWVVLSRQNAY